MSAKAQSVYLIRERATGLFKIGISKNANQRLAQLQRAAAGRLRLIHLIASLDAPELERFLHEKFQERRVHSEWFRLSQEDVAFVLNLDHFATPYAQPAPEKQTKFIPEKETIRL